MKWLAYFQKRQKLHVQQAIDHATGDAKASSASPTDDPIEYGEVVYQSAPFMGRRWIVTNFQNEFTIFVESIFRSGRTDRLFANAFATKDRAVAFATEMFLVCCGRVTLRNRRCLGELTKISK